MHMDTFTTRIETLFGVSYLAIAPEHPHLQKWMETLTEEKQRELDTFRIASIRLTKAERGESSSRGISTDLVAIHPLSKEKVRFII